jgi:hypothetical protein
VFRLTTRAQAGSDPLQGIAAAQSASAGLPDATALAQLQALQGAIMMGEVLGDARALTTLAGHRTYVLPMSTGGFCFFAEGLGEECRGPLTPTDPVLFDEFDRDGPGGAGPTAVGVAEDGVESLTITEDGVVNIVPVQGNVFYFTGAPSADSEPFSSVIANFVDGQHVPVT